MNLNILQVIQMLVAPVVMISACGLLCLAFYNRLAVIVGRVRGLDHERRGLNEKEKQGYDVKDRLRVLDRQIHEIILRARLVRNTLACLVICIACMIVCSLLLGLSVITTTAASCALFLFIVGLLCMLTGMFFALAELGRSLRPMELEAVGEEASKEPEAGSK